MHTCQFRRRVPWSPCPEKAISLDLRLPRATSSFAPHLVFGTTGRAPPVETLEIPESHTSYECSDGFRTWYVQSLRPAVWRAYIRRDQQKEILLATAGRRAAPTVLPRTPWRAAARTFHSVAR